jgi:hypothetical protein
VIGAAVENRPDNRLSRGVQIFIFVGYLDSWQIATFCVTSATGRGPHGKAPRWAVGLGLAAALKCGVAPKEFV